MVSQAMQIILVLGILQAEATVKLVYWSGLTYVVPRASAGDSSLERAPRREGRCLTKPNPGECRGAFPRFFYNETTDQCDCFLYGGCGEEPLQSSWLTLNECNDICIPGNLTEGPRCGRLMPKQEIQSFTENYILTTIDTSNISDAELIDIFTRVNPENNQGDILTTPDISNLTGAESIDILTGDPENNQKGDSSLGRAARREKRCLTKPNPGECRGAFPRFFYNETTDQCDCFLHGGCGEELLQSSWLTLNECNDICIPGNLTEGPRCRLLPKQEIQTFTENYILATPDTLNLTDAELINLLSGANPENNQGDILTTPDISNHTDVVFLIN